METTKMKSILRIVADLTNERNSLRQQLSEAREAMQKVVDAPPIIQAIMRSHNLKIDNLIERSTEKGEGKRA
jgi:hypothetical protein